MGDEAISSSSEWGEKIGLALERTEPLIRKFHSVGNRI